MIEQHSYFKETNNFHNEILHFVKSYAKLKQSLMNKNILIFWFTSINKIGKQFLLETFY